MNDDDAREKNDSSVISRRDLLRTAGAAGAAALADMVDGAVVRPDSTKGFSKVALPGAAPSLL